MPAGSGRVPKRALDWNDTGTIAPARWRPMRARDNEITTGENINIRTRPASMVDCDGLLQLLDHVGRVPRVTRSVGRAIARLHRPGEVS
jgi:hypothetical protein